MRQRAFTLIELLVVVAIIAILASLALPAIALVRAASRQSVCAGALRQIGIAMGGYADDWDGLLPSLRRTVVAAVPTVHWFQPLAPYLDAPADGAGGAYAEMATLRSAERSPIWAARNGTRRCAGTPRPCPATASPDTA